jgi:hypothetical protein
MEKHMNLLGWLYIVLNGIFVALALVLYGMVSGIALLSGVQEIIIISRTSAAIAAVFLSILAIPGVIVGFGLLARAEWARVIALILGIINLFNFPLGTLLGIYTLWVIARYQSRQQASSADERRHHSGQGALT